MISQILTAGLIFFFTGCNPKLSSTDSIAFNEGLFFGYKSGVLSSAQFFVVIKKDTSYLQYFRQMNGVVEMPFADTLLYQNDTLYTGKLTSLIRTNRLYLVNLENNLTWKLNIKLAKADNRLKKKWDSNNNSVHYASVNRRYSEVYQKLPEGTAKKLFYNANHALARKIFELDQAAFRVEVLKFENEFLVNK